jgi:hypothetical protein
MKQGRVVCWKWPCINILQELSYHLSPYVLTSTLNCDIFMWSTLTDVIHIFTHFQIIFFMLLDLTDVCPLLTNAYQFNNQLDYRSITKQTNVRAEIWTSVLHDWKRANYHLSYQPLTSNNFFWRQQWYSTWIYTYTKLIIQKLSKPFHCI